MRFDIHIHYHEPETARLLRGVIADLAQLREAIMTDLSRLTAAVEKQTTVTQSAITLIQGLAQAIRDLPANQKAIDDLAAEVDAKAQALSDAVTANTPTP